MPARRDLADQIIDSWQDYEEGRSKEALWVREMDKLECMIQAHEYEQQTFGEKDLEEFQGLTPKIISPEGKLWLELLQSERHAHLAKRRYRLPVIFIAGQTNDPNIQAALTSSETWLQFLSLDSILRKKAEDQAYIHAEFLRQCLEEELPVPRSLSVNLLEQTIQEGLQQGKWTVVYGFPADKEHLLEFERKVSFCLVTPPSGAHIVLGTKNKLLNISRDNGRYKLVPRAEEVHECSRGIFQRSKQVSQLFSALDTLTNTDTLGSWEA